MDAMERNHAREEDTEVAAGGDVPDAGAAATWGGVRFPELVQIIFRDAQQSASLAPIFEKARARARIAQIDTALPLADALAQDPTICRSFIALNPQMNHSEMDSDEQIRIRPQLLRWEREMLRAICGDSPVTSQDATHANDTHDAAAPSACNLATGDQCNADAGETSPFATMIARMTAPNESTPVNSGNSCAITLMRYLQHRCYCCV